VKSKSRYGGKAGRGFSIRKKVGECWVGKGKKRESSEKKKKTFVYRKKKKEEAVQRGGGGNPSTEAVSKAQDQAKKTYGSLKKKRRPLERPRGCRAKELKKKALKLEKRKAQEEGSPVRGTFQRSVC